MDLTGPWIMTKGMATKRSKSGQVPMFGDPLTIPLPLFDHHVSHPFGHVLVSIWSCVVGIIWLSSGHPFGNSPVCFGHTVVFPA